MSDNQLRIDKYLWSMRIYKTRSLAADACKRGRVLINGVQAKSSRVVAEGDSIMVYKPPVQYTYKALKLSGKRLGAKLVPDYIENLTPQEEKDKLIRPKFPDFGQRQRGAGRPTKRERRDMDKFQDWDDS